MEDMKKQMENIEALQKEQELHRMQLEENRKKALTKKNQTKKLTALGAIVEDFLPGTVGRDEEEIRDILRERLMDD